MPNILRASGVVEAFDVPRVKTKKSKIDTFKRLQAAVGGPVQYLTLDATRVLALNEEAGLLGKPLNAAASAMLQAAGGERETVQLRGDVVVMHPSEVPG